MGKGPLCGFPLLDVKITLTDGGFHAVDSSQMAFEIAAKAAFRQTMPKAGPELLEPIMKVDVYVPDANVGDVIGDLNRRRGMIKSQDPGPMNVHIKANVPLSEMFGCIGDRVQTPPVAASAVALRRNLAVYTADKDFLQYEKLLEMKLHEPRG